MKVGDLIPIGGSGSAKPEHVLNPETFSSDEGVDMVGEIENLGSLNKIITTQNGLQKISKGYYEGGEVKAQFANLVPENIRNGINIGGVVGDSNLLSYNVDSVYMKENEGITLKFDKPPAFVYCRYEESYSSTEYAIIDSLSFKETFEMKSGEIRARLYGNELQLRIGRSDRYVNILTMFR